MIVWIFSSGEYEEHGVRGVYATKAGAEEAAARSANDEMIAVLAEVRRAQSRVVLRTSPGFAYYSQTPEEVAARTLARELAATEITEWEVQP